MLPHFKDLSVFMVNNADDMDKLMTMGNRTRSIGATNMNALSSRSHAIFSITVECSEKTVGNCEGKLCKYMRKTCNGVPYNIKYLVVRYLSCNCLANS